MKIKKISWLIIFIMLCMFTFSGCVENPDEPLSVEYEITIDNPSNESFNISLPTLILGNRVYNTPREGKLKPIVDIEDYSVIEGTANFSYMDTNNATLLNISSSSEKVKIELSKNKFDDDKYVKYVDDEYYKKRICPFLNSYYHGKEKIGIVNDEKSSLNLTFHFESRENDGDDYWMDESFNIERDGFQLKKVKINYQQPAP